jgi:hypothetical protein
VALGHDVRESALSAWRAHATAAHAAISACERARHDGLVVVHDVDAPLSTTARLVRDYRSPEPVVAAVASGGDAVAVAGTPDVNVGDVLARVTTQTGGAYDGTPEAGYATVDCDTTEFVESLRAAL